MEELKLILETISKLGSEARLVFIIWCLKEIAHLPLLGCILYWVVRGVKTLWQHNMFGVKVANAGGYVDPASTSREFDKYIIAQAADWKEKNK